MTAQPITGRSPEQEQFGASLHGLLSEADAPGAARRWAGGDRSAGLALWRKLAGLGVTGLAVPQRWGGVGASLADVVVACEELGHHAVPGPVAESAAAVPELLAALADERLSARWLPGLAAGDLIATLALPPWLPYAADADAAGLVLLAEPGAVRLASAGGRHRSVDPARSLSPARGGEVLARGPAAAGAVARAREAGTLACAAQLLGAGRALLEASVGHARQRSQFGRPIGSFQAVKHQLADVAIGLEFARPLLDAAAVTLTPRDVSAAKVACAGAAQRAARAALQVHGAIGYTQEHDLYLWLTKVRALAGAWGSQAGHRARVMAAIADGGLAWS
ncbi:MAG TPA: acyl-CoA dehydrogenase family protein [Streptosporangiaceae bacterium]